MAMLWKSNTMEVVHASEKFSIHDCPDELIHIYFVLPVSGQSANQVSFQLI